MSNPNDDPDVISGLCDDAKKEMATYPGPSHLNVLATLAHNLLDPRGHDSQWLREVLI